MNKQLHFSTVSIPEDIEKYLRDCEHKILNLIPGCEKKIVWFDKRCAITEYVCVYIHGFSATRMETAPFAEKVAKKIGANLYYTRLKGHGRTGEDLANATIKDWAFDLSESIAIAKKIGQKIVIIGCSTGATCGTWLASLSKISSIKALVNISPNFGLVDKRSVLLSLPFSEYYISLLLGAQYSWQPLSELHGVYWTSQYPSKALVTMMCLVNWIKKIDLKKIKIPLITFYSQKDCIVDPIIIVKLFNYFGSDKKKIVHIDNCGNSEHHVLAGDILSKNTTNRLVNDTYIFLKNNVLG